MQRFFLSVSIFLICLFGFPHWSFAEDKFIWIWNRPNIPRGDFEADKYECVKEVMAMAAISGASGTVLTTALSPLLESCIRGKGWKRETPEDIRLREERTKAKAQSEALSYLEFVVGSILSNTESTKNETEKIRLAGQEGLKILYEDKNLLTLPPEKFEPLRDALKKMMVASPEDVKKILNALKGRSVFEDKTGTK
jgi:hypothetical protein